MKEAGLAERYKSATFDRQAAIRNPQAEFLAIGHPFVDAMIRHIGEYDFDSQTAVRVIRMPDLEGDSFASGFQFNFTVRRRVAREDGDEHLFDWHTVVVRADGGIDEKLAEAAARQYSASANGESPMVTAALTGLSSGELEKAFESAKSYLEQRIQLWDWDEEVDLIGVAKVIFLPAIS